MARFASVKSDGGGGMAETLLWTNSSPTSAFSSQTLSLDLTKYEYIKLVLKYTATGTYIQELIIKNDTAFGYVTLGGGNTTVIAAGATRKCKILNNGIEFGGGYSVVGESSNTYVIPLNIYGIECNTSHIQKTYRGVFTAPLYGGSVHVNIGFKPDYVIAWNLGTNSYTWCSEKAFLYTGAAQGIRSQSSGITANNTQPFTMDDNGFTFAYNTNNIGEIGDLIFVACKY